MATHSIPTHSPGGVRLQTIERTSIAEQREHLRQWYIGGNVHSRDVLVHSSVRLTSIIARKYRDYGQPISQLIAHGNLGVWQAISRYTLDDRMRFATYAAYWIRIYVLNHLIRTLRGSDAHMPAASRRPLFKLRREWARIASLLGDSGPFAEMSGFGPAPCGQSTFRYWRAGKWDTLPACDDIHVACGNTQDQSACTSEDQMYLERAE